MIYVNGQRIRPEYFSDGTFKLDLSRSGIEVSCVHKDFILFTWLYENESELSLVWQLANHFRDNGMTLYRLNIPYLPNARMDRVRDQKHEVLTLKHFCRFINALEFEEVCVFDPHSDVAGALIDRLVIESPELKIGRVLSEADKCLPETGSEIPIVVFPDCGSMHRYARYVGPAYPTAYGVKKRNWNTGAIESLRLVSDEDFSGRNVVIIDDICPSGGTILEIARAVRELGAKLVYVYVSHLDPKVGAKALIDSPFIDRVYTMDSRMFTFSEISLSDKITIL